MLKIHKPFSKHKLLLIPITSICIISGLLGFYCLTYTPELSHAETVDNVDRHTMDDITYMQDITPDICQNSELNKQYTLTDIRDDNTYTVARIKNQTNDESNCWMTQNLRITDKWVSSRDSDIEKGSFAIPKSDISGFIGDSDKYQPKAYYDIYNQSYGGYYNWYTATAGTGGASLISGSAPSSICPKGWKMPVGGSQSGDYYNALSGLSAKELLEEPYLFVLSGYIFQGEVSTRYYHGYYFTADAKDIDTAFVLSFRSNISENIVGFTGFQFSRVYGLPTRCIARVKENNNVEITVNPIISLDVANEVNVEKSETNPSTASLDVKVTSNQKYSVEISASNPNLISTISDVKIPAKSGLLNTAENGWGIKLSNDTNYTALTTSLQTFYTASGAEIKTIPFTIGISTTPDLPNGEYSTDITITATQN